MQTVDVMSITSNARGTLNTGKVSMWTGAGGEDIT